MAWAIAEGHSGRDAVTASATSMRALKTAFGYGFDWQPDPATLTQLRGRIGMAAEKRAELGKADHNKTGPQHREGAELVDTAIELISERLSARTTVVEQADRQWDAGRLERRVGVPDLCCYRYH